MATNFEDKFVSKDNFLDGLKALYIALLSAEKLMTQDSFSSGYFEGYCDALRATAQIGGGLEDFLEFKNELAYGESQNQRLVVGKG